MENKSEGNRRDTDKDIPVVFNKIAYPPVQESVLLK